MGLDLGGGNQQRGSAQAGAELSRRREGSTTGHAKGDGGEDYKGVRAVAAWRLLE